MKKLYLFISLLLSLFVAACSSTNTKMSEMSAECYGSECSGR